MSYRPFLLCSMQMTSCRHALPQDSSRRTNAGARIRTNVYAPVVNLEDFLRDFILAHKYANCMKLFMKKAHCLLKPCAKKLHYIASGSICVALMVASFSVSPAEPQTEMLRSLCTVFGLHQTYNFTFKPRSSI